MRLVKFPLFNNVLAVDGFQKEFERTVKETKTDGRYHRWLRRKLSVLDASSYRALDDRDFECLQNTNPKLYAIRYPHSILNPRVIYAYIDNGKACLLCAFKETSKNKNSDYRTAIVHATNLLNEVQNMI